MSVLPVTDPVLIVAITMGILLLAPLLFERMRVPGLVGLIVFGALVGPSVLGLLERDATFELLGTVGLLYLMFVAGITLDLNEFARQRTRSLGFGALSFGMPMALAMGVGPLVGYSPAASALLGAIVGSHTLLAYPLAARLGITRNPAVVTATGATLITDLLSLLVLAVVAASLDGDTSAWFWMRFAALVVLWGAAVLLLLPRMGGWFLRRVSREADVTFAFLMAMLFLSAWFARAVGLAPIIGAFLAGLALNRLIPITSPLMTRVRFVGDALLIPFFLVSVGLLVDVRVLASPAVWGLAGVFLGLVVVGKGGAALLAGAAYRFSWAERLAVAGLTIPQAAATLAVTLVGFDLGLFSQAAVNAVVVLILLSCLIGPSLVRRFGREVALADEEAPYAPTEAPQRILIPLANPETAEELVELALLIRAPTSEEPIYPLAVAHPEDDHNASVAAAERLMERAVLHAAAADVPCTPVTRIDDNVAAGILRGIRENRISTVLIGWSGRATPGSLIFGSVLDQVLEESRAMVIVSRLVQPVQASRRTVLVVPPFAYRESGFAAALRALKILAARNGHTIVVLAAAEEADALRLRLERQRPDAPVTVRPLATWGGLLPTLAEVVRPDDLLVQLSVRRGALAWRPTLERLPRVLAGRFEGNDLAVVYLAEALPAAPGGDGAPAPAAPSDALHPLYVSLLKAPEGLDEVLRRTLAPGFPEARARAAEVAATLVEERGPYAPELRPGVTFYHAHTDAMAEPTLFVGVSHAGLTLPQASGPVHVVLVLLSPRDLAPGAHLRRLAAIARLLSEPTVEALRLATTPDAARAALLGAADPVPAVSPPSVA